MKKILISAMLIVMGCFSMAAQNSIVNNPDNKAYFGIRSEVTSHVPANLLLMM